MDERRALWLKDIAHVASQRDELLALFAGEKRTPDVVGQIGGIYRKSRGDMLFCIAQGLIENQPGREQVRAFLKHYFGQSIASGDLKKFARPARSGAGRGEKPNPPNWLLKAAISDFFEHAYPVKTSNGYNPNYFLGLVAD